MTVLITAFGPFNGRKENASSLAIRGLKKAFPSIHTRILPVDAVIAPARLKQAIRLIRPDCLIMLGEAGGGKKIRLETTAWNELDFRIPDIAGRQFSSRPIQPGSPASRKSTLPLEEIHALLDEAGHAVAHSDDAGRYLCNQLFYVALEYLELKSITVPAGFIHLPLEQDYPTSRVVEGLSQIIRMLNHSLAGPPA